MGNPWKSIMCPNGLVDSLTNGLDALGGLEAIFRNLHVSKKNSITPKSMAFPVDKAHYFSAILSIPPET